MYIAPLELFVPRIYIFTALLGMCGNPDFAHGLLQLFELPRLCSYIESEWSKFSHLREFAMSLTVKSSWS
jgi:hypothetical protein